MIRFESPTLGHCQFLMSNLRPADRAEVDKAGRLTPEEMFEACNNEDSQAVFTEEGELICIFGVWPLPKNPEVGIVWLLGTSLLDSFMFALCKRAPAVLNEWLTKYKRLTNVTDKQNRHVIMWLRWLGFRLIGEVSVRGHPFVHFIKDRSCAIPSASQ